MISINFNYNVQTDSIPSQDAPQELREKKDMTKMITAIALIILCGIGVFFYARHTNLSAHSLSHVNLCSETIRIITQLAQAVLQIFMNEALKTVVKIVIGCISVYVVAKGIANLYLHKGEKAIKEGKPSKALVALKNIPKIQKQSSRALRLEVLTHMLLGNAVRVRHSSLLLDKQIEKTDHDDVILSLSHLFLGNLAYSIDFANRAKSKNNKNPSAWMLLAGQNLLLGDIRSFYSFSDHATSFLCENVTATELVLKKSDIRRQRFELTKSIRNFEFFLNILSDMSALCELHSDQDSNENSQAIIPNQFLKIFDSYKKLFDHICCGKIQSRKAIEADPRFNKLSQFSKLNLLSSLYHKKGQLELALNHLKESTGFVPFSSCLLYKKRFIEDQMNGRYKDQSSDPLMFRYKIHRSFIYLVGNNPDHEKFFVLRRASPQLCIFALNYLIKLDETPEDQIMNIMKLVFQTLRI